MRNSRIIANRDKLNYLLKNIKISSFDFELQSHWAKYLCVLTSGFLENSIRIICGEYVKNKAAPFVQNFVDKELNRFQNPDMNKIIDLVSRFSQDWGDCLKTITEGELKDSVDSIVANKNNIAHGQSIGLTFVQLEKYYKNVLKVIEIIEDHCI
jgi:formyltetrahydrofolate hydrolase